VAADAVLSAPAAGPAPKLERRRSLQLLAAGLALVVIGLGAFVRLSDAGLGCPDWPGCYGHWLGVPVSDAETAAAAAAYPGKPVDPGRAWKEMVHRYAAGTLGLLILGFLVDGWRRARRDGVPWLESALAGVVVCQALLGMWTVTQLLKPLIVTVHLLGGMLTLSLLLALVLRRGDATAAPALPAAPRLRRAGTLALLALFFQIALGGWVSSNYAALACQGFPACNGDWWPAADWTAGFEIWRELGQTAAGGELPADGLIAIHWAHRLGALCVLGFVGLFAWRLRQAGRPGAATLLAALLALQLGLGIANVLLHLPLPLAVAHNLGAALLLSACLSLRLGR
jgi:cytochrome c oxidase assembly protein subunit 15